MGLRYVEVGFTVAPDLIGNLKSHKKLEDVGEYFAIDAKIIVQVPVLLNKNLIKTKAKLSLGSYLRRPRRRRRIRKTKMVLSQKEIVKRHKAGATG